MCAQDWSHPHDVDPWQGDQCGSLQHCHYDYHHHHHQHHHIIIIIIITIIIIDMTQLLLLGKVEYGGGPIFKVVLEC